MAKTSEIIEKRLPTFAAIAQRAHEIYLARGCQPGREQDDWLQAEYELMQVPIRKIATLPASKLAKGKKKIVAKAVKASALIMLVQSALTISSSTIA